MKDDYKSESLEAAEIGMKSILLDRHLQRERSPLFYTTVEDMQFFNFFAGPFGLLRVVTNIDEVTIQGVEIDFRWNVNDIVQRLRRLCVHRRRDRQVQRPAVHRGQRGAVRAGVHRQPRRRVARSRSTTR